MQVTLSVATTADGYMDDRTDRRLILSSPGDWAEVYRLRGEHDAILVGAETLRRDNPSLCLRDEELRRRRLSEGRRADIAKVTLTASGELDPSLNFFTAGDADRYIFSRKPIEGVDGLAEVILCDGVITPAVIITALERRGIRSLLVEGGASVLHRFLASGLVDTLRLAVNPAIRLGIERGYARFEYELPANALCRREQVDGMEVTTCTLRPDTAEEDRACLRRAIEESRRCRPSATSYCVGAVIRTLRGEYFTGYTHESSPTHHAEQEAIRKALAAGADLRGGAIYSSMEPCSTRKSEPESCTQLILRHGFAHVAFALYEPDCFVCCHGAEMLRAAGIDLRVYPELGDEVLAVNAHLWQDKKG